MTNSINYEKLCDYTLHNIEVMELRNTSAINILSNLRNSFYNRLINTKKDYHKYMSIKMIRTIDKFTDNLEQNQALTLVKKALDYDSETTYFQKVRNAFTIVEYFFEKDALDYFKTDYKNLMEKNK